MISPCFKFCQSPLVILCEPLSHKRFERIWSMMVAPWSMIGDSSSFCCLVMLVAYFKKMRRILTSNLHVHLSCRISDSRSCVTKHFFSRSVYSEGCMPDARFGVNFEMNMFEKTICLLRICCKFSGLFSIKRLIRSTCNLAWALSFSMISIVNWGVTTGDYPPWIKAFRPGWRKQFGMICLRYENSVESAVVKWLRRGKLKWVKSTPLIFMFASFTTY